MILGKRIALAVVCWMMCLRLTVSQGSIPAPKLSFSKHVNESNIRLSSTVSLECSVEASAPFPIIMYLGKFKGPLQTSDTAVHWQISDTIRYSKSYTFYITAESSTEDDIVCWYKSTRNVQTSGFSNPVKLVISSLPPPKVTVKPKVFTVGGNYSVYCEPTIDTTNFSLSLYYRTLPVTPQTTLFSMGSLNLTGKNNMIYVNQTKANIQVEYACTMKMLYNGKVLESPLSNFEAAIPEELRIQLMRNGRRGGCLGNLNINVRENWQPVCQKPTSTDVSSEAEAAASAEVACRDLGCGNALDWKRVVDTSLRATATGVRCSGKETKISECPTEDLACNDINTIYIVCSDALPPPKLFVVTYGSVPTLYVTDKQSVKITCSFSSLYLTSYDTTDMVFRRSGSMLRDPYININSSVTLEIYDPVPEGVYDCVLKFDRTFLSRASNPVVIYRYNPPDPVPIVVGVLTTVVGAAIMIYICVFKKKQETQETEGNEIPRSSCDPEATNTHTAQPEYNVNYLPQQM